MKNEHIQKVTIFPSGYVLAAAWINLETKLALLLGMQVIDELI